MFNKFYLLALALVFFVNAEAQQYQLFNYGGEYKSGKNDPVKKGSALLLEREQLELLYSTKPSGAEIILPLNNRTLILELKKAKLFSGNVNFILASNLKNISYEEGYYLQGKLKGDENSVAAISIFKNYLGGIVSFEGKTYDLVLANNDNRFSSDHYVLYAQEDCTLPRPQCFTKDDADWKYDAPLSPQRTLVDVGCPVDIYFETGLKSYQQLGNNPQNVLNYLTILFNAMQTLYGAESIRVQIREVLIWDIPEDEYTLTNTTDALNSFSSRMIFGFNGDLAHYVTHNSLGGGRAYLDVLCSSSSSRQVAVSGNLQTNYPALPNYSFTVMVITHETGHNLGSPHTHSCTWPGGAIDNCYATEGGCSPGTAPVNGGTIMSYCHTNFSIGVNFANGFGPLPGNLIRSKVTQAQSFNCNCDCGNIKAEVTTQDIGCGNPTGSASVQVTDGAGPFTYQWSNGASTPAVTGLTAGTYYVTVTGSSPNCKVIKGFKILNSGNAIVVNMNPSAVNVNRCPGDNYNVSVTVNPAGSYTYQWYKNSVAVAGATASSYTISSTGIYFVIATGSTCIGQSANINAVFQNVPVPVVSTSGSTNICANETVQLSIPATTYTIEWQKNGVAIAGATAANYIANTAGNYTVKLSSPGNAACFAVSAPVTVTIKTVPATPVSPTGNQSFCQNDQGTLTHNPVVAGETYRWFRNNTVITGETNPVLQLSVAGNYSLEVTGTNGCRNRSTDVVFAVNPLPSKTLNPASSVTLCDGGTLTLTATPGHKRYEWFNAAQPVSPGAGNSITVSGSGNYWVKITSINDCINSSDTTRVTIIPPPRIFAGNDTVLATGQAYRLNAYELTSLGIERYEWSPATGLDNANSASPVAILYETQQYVATGIHASGCRAMDTVVLKIYKGPAIYVPGAFSPNGVNKDVGFVAVGLKSFKFLAIYNRYGQMVFHTSNPMARWNGTKNGQPLDAGTYVWIAEAEDYTGKPLHSKGTIIIIR